MKFNRYIGLALGLTALLSGCADNDMDYRPWDGEMSDELTLNLHVADPELVRLGQTRGEDGPLTTVALLEYQGGTWKKTTENVPVTNGKITVKLDKNTTEIQLVANHTVTSQNPATEVTSDALPTTDDEVEDWTPILWGKASLNDIKNNVNNPDVALYRQTAKVTIASKPENFEISGFNLYNVATSGTVGANLSKFNSEATEPSNVAYSTDKKIHTDFAYLYETSKKDDKHHPKIIIKGTYNNVEGYYVVGFRSRSNKTTVADGTTNYPEKYEYTDLEILRNHEYKVTVESVRAEGWPTIEAAQAAEPDNRAVIWVSDETANITDMIASRDYMLGVSDDVVVEWSGNAEIAVVSSFPSSETDPVKIVVLDPTNTPWIKTTGMTKTEGSSTTDNSEKDKPKTVKHYTYTIQLDNNSAQTADRVGYIEVRVGDLSRTVKITQKGRALRRARTAKIFGLTGLTDGTDYYNWVDNDCLGLEPVQNRGLERNNALIFAAVPAYDIYYKIPKTTPGETKADTGYELDNTTDFSVTTEGDYWVVRALGAGPKIASAKLTLIGGEDGNTRIDYDLLRVGFFHMMDDSKKNYTVDYKNYPISKGNVNWGRWHYYEVVKVGAYYILDRNFGATSNASYDPSNTNYSEEDPNAVGGYFVVNPIRAIGDAINTTDSKKRYMDLTNLRECMGLKYDLGSFYVPSVKEFENIGVTFGNHGSGALRLDVDEVSEVANQQIYIPAAGYYFGTLQKNTVHVNLWTRTLLGGSQGLTETDNEYGTQYRYLDGFGGMVTFGNLRTSAGADGVVNHTLRNYVPVRLIWRSTDDPLDGTEGSVTPPTPTDTKYRISWTTDGDFWQIGLFDESNNEISSYKTNFKIDNDTKFAMDYTDLPANFRIKIKFRKGDGGDVRVPQGNKVYTASDFSPSGELMLLHISTLAVEEETPSNPDPIEELDPNYSYKIKGSMFGNWSDNDVKTMTKQADGTFLYEGKFDKGSFGIQAIKDNKQEKWIFGEKDNSTIKVNDSNNCVIENDAKDNGSNFIVAEEGNYILLFNPKSLTLNVTKVVAQDNATYSLRSNYNGEWSTVGMSKSGEVCSITVNATRNFNFLFYKNEPGKDQVEIKSDWDNTTVQLNTEMSSTSSGGSNWWVDKGSGRYTITYNTQSGITKIVKN